MQYEVPGALPLAVMSRRFSAPNIPACGTLIRKPQTLASPLLTNSRPVDSNDPPVCEPFQRLWKNKIGCAFSLFEPNHSEIRPAFALQDCHHTVFLDLRLEVAVSGRLLHQRVDLGVYA